MPDTASAPENTAGIREPGTGRFVAGNPGKPKGARHALAESFVKALASDWNAHGVEALAKVRENDPTNYVKVVAGLLPKEITGEDGAPLLTGITVTFVQPKKD